MGRRPRIMTIAALLAMAGCASTTLPDRDSESPSDDGGVRDDAAGAGGGGVRDAGDGAGTGGRSGTGGPIEAGAGGTAGAGGIAGHGGAGTSGMEPVPMAGAGGDTGGGGAGGIVIRPDPISPCDDSGAFDPLIARDGETCYDLLVHQGDGVSPLVVPTGESFTRFYYDIPWSEGAVATRFGIDLDNTSVLYRWHVFASDATEWPSGSVRAVTDEAIEGNATLIAGWSVGSCPLRMPPNIGLELPARGSKQLVVQWHHYNNTGQPQPDATKVQVCTVPRESVLNIASITRLGTEVLGDGIPSGVESKFSGTCANATAMPIYIFHLWPHMRELGTNIVGEVMRANGSSERVLDRPFSVDYQEGYYLDPIVVLEPGDRIRSECTYFNGTGQSVSLGASSGQEVCQQYAFAYPAGALDKPGLPSLLGGTSNCWGD